MKCKTACSAADNVTRTDLHRTEPGEREGKLLGPEWSQEERLDQWWMEKREQERGDGKAALREAKWLVGNHIR
jgi:hypothetical protein